MPLIINDIEIEHLSGLSCVHILTPKNKSLPIILNLGEIHINITNPCTTELNAIDIPNFLTQLNILASTFRTEIYSENFMDYDLLALAKKEDTKKKEWEEAMSFTEQEGSYKGALGIFNNIENTVSCYYKDLRTNHNDIFKSKCAYPNIIWQYSDARKTFRSRHFESLYTVENITDVYFTIEHIINKFAFVNDVYYKNFKFKDMKPAKLDSIEKKYAHINKVVNDYVDEKCDIPLLINVIQLILDFHESPGKAAETIINVPIIMKQLQKQKWVDSVQFKQYVKEYIIHVLNEYDKSDKILVCYLEFMKTFILFLENNNLENIQKVVETTNSLLLCKPSSRGGLNYDTEGDIPVQLMLAPASIIMDVYFILRILKPPKKDLVCNLAGTGHTHHISHFLTKISHLYDNSVFTTTTKKNQCVHFDLDMDLNEVLRNRKQSISLKRSISTSTSTSTSTHKSPRYNTERTGGKKTRKKRYTKLKKK